MAQRGLKSSCLWSLGSGNREQVLWGRFSRMRQFLKVSQRWKSSSLDWNGLVRSPGKKEKNPSKILTMGKHFCNKERASPYEKASYRKGFRMVVFGV